MDTERIVVELVESGLAGCGHLVADHGGLLASLFLAGLVGSASHCAGMCGPFVLAQSATRLCRLPAGPGGELRRLAGALLLPYHLGRSTSYVGLGVLAALAAGGIMQLAELRWLSAALLALAALSFLATGAGRLGLAMAWPATGFGRFWAGRVTGLARPLFSNPAGWRGYGLGLLLGFIPCGLLYGALAAAASSGSAPAAAAGMAAFALGTVPMLVAVAWLGGWAAGRWRQVAGRIGPALMIANAGLLLALAWRWVA
jgi:sulfite exporter TauE/SafE